MNRKNSLIIVSGGMDSITLLHDYHQEIALAVTFNYGSKHNEKEMPFARMHCEALGIPHLVIPLEFINQYFKSDLLQSGGDIPEGHYADENMKSTVVPFRNGIMLSIAAGIAESNDLERILMANHFGDHAIYPDCRESFVKPMNEAIKNGTYKQIEIFAPYTLLVKRQIALIGQKHGIDYSTTWTCYKGDDVHCGVCGSCVERKEALEGFDSTVYLK